MNMNTIPPRIHVLAKPSGATCNLACSYCFFLDKELLNHLERANLFLNPLDDQHNWYRYHHLFAEFLRQRIREVQPEIVPKLFVRASHWYEDQGMLDEAIEYAFLGDDYMRAARLLDENAENLILVNAEITQLISWAYRLPKKVRAN
jgi:LuxR family maltose regulon positive regulatory protein